MKSRSRIEAIAQSSLEAKRGFFRVGCTPGVARCSLYHFKAKILLITNLLVNMHFECPKGLVTTPVILIAIYAIFASFGHFAVYVH